ncbi:MAG: hypothetical protein P4L71_06075 [Acetobacteraceae bacterium]|nr:hypothetical protein [Acetobacteraceae bacterium]
MNDTVSAATVSAAANLLPGGVRLAFLAPSDVGQSGVDQSPAWSAAHIPGSIHTADAAPSLIVNFTTLSPDAYGWVPVAPPVQAFAGVDSMPPTVSGYAAGIPDDPGPGIVGALSSI